MIQWMTNGNGNHHEGLLDCNLLVFAFVSALQGSQNLERARQLEESGDGLGARALLAQPRKARPDNIAALTEYAEFLDRHARSGRTEAYDKLLAALDGSAHSAQRAAVARRMVELSFLPGDRTAASRSLEIYQSAGGSVPGIRRDARLRRPRRRRPPICRDTRTAALVRPHGGHLQRRAARRSAARPGAQCGHQRLPGVPQQRGAGTDRVPEAGASLSLAGARAGEAGRPGKVIKIETCDSPNAGELLRILGFRMRGGCGSEVVLETVNATRAFLTTDSGFPIPALEQALRTNRPFTYDYHPARVPVLFGADYWLSAKEKETSDFIDVFLSDPALCRLYLGISKLDRETAEEFRKNIPMPRLKAYAHVLDFFGGMFEIRDGKAVVPGAPRTAAAWTELAGASPDQGAAFFEKLIAKDDGWLASYYDALARINGPVQDYLTEPARMKRFYPAIRGKVTSPGPARPVFRSNADMMLLTTRLWMEPDGRPHIPGNLEVWKDLFANHPQGKYDGKLTRAAGAWKEPDDVLEALFGLTPQGRGERAAEDLHGAQRSGSLPFQTAGAGDGGPAGAQLSRVRQPVCHLQRRRHRERQIHRPIHGYGARRPAASRIRCCAPTRSARCSPWWDCGRSFPAQGACRLPRPTRPSPRC